MVRRTALQLGIAMALAIAFLASRRDSSERPAPQLPSATPSQVTPPAVQTVPVPLEVPSVREALPTTELAGDWQVESRIEQEREARFEVRARVEDDLGSPVTRFTIDRMRPRAAEWSIGFSSSIQASEATLDFESPDGSFRIGGLDAGQWQLTAHVLPGNRRSAPVVVSIPEESEGIVLIVPRCAEIRGLVLDPGGVGVAEAGVYLHYPGEEHFSFRHDSASVRQATTGSSGMVVLGYGFEPEPQATTESSGEFVLAGVLPGAVEVMARHPQYCDSEWMKLTVAPGALVQGIEIELSQGGRIEGSLSPSLGELSDREIGLFSFRGLTGWRDARTDALGSFVIELVMPQDYVIELRPPNWGEAEYDHQPGIRKNISVREGETTQVVFGEARRPVLLHGRVTAGGLSSAGLSIDPYSRESEDTGASVVTDADGRFELTVPGSGNYTFNVSDDDGSHVRLEREVPDQVEVDLVLEVPTGAILGRVLDEQGRPLDHVPITVVRSGSTRETFYRDCYRRVRTEEDGSFRFGLLQPGTYTLRAPDGNQHDSPPPRVPYGRIVLTDLVVEHGEVSGLDLRLPPEGRISGVVVDALAVPVTDARIRVLDQRDLFLAGDGWDSQTDATGHFQVDNVAPGLYSVRAWSGDREMWSAVLAVEAGRTASARLVLR